MPSSPHRPQRRPPAATRFPAARAGARLIAALLIVISFTLHAYAIEPDRLVTQYAHQSWTSNEGLPQDSAHAIAQTPDGYLWVATQEGIARFDGTTFTLFDSRTTGGIVADFIFALFVDSSGTLWAGGGNGVLRYEGSGRWRRYGPAEGWPGISGKFISEDAAGNLWVSMGNEYSTGGHGLVRLKDRQAKLYTEKDGLTSNQVFQTAPAADGSLWIGTRNGLNVLRDGRFSSYGVADGLPDANVGRLLFDRKGTLWVGTSAGLARMRDGRVTAVYTTREGLPDDRIVSMVEDSNGVLWIGTHRGLARMINGEIEPVTTVDAFTDNMILSLFEDRERNLWVGVQASGLHRLRSASFTPFGPPEGLIGSSVHAIAQDPSGRMWIGTAPGGVSVSSGGRFASPGAPFDTEVHDARALLHSRDGAVWIGNRGALHRELDGELTTWGVQDGLPNPDVRTIYEDMDGTILIGTGEGLARFDGTGLKTVPLPRGAPKSIKVIHRAHDGKLWIGGADGLGYFRGDRFTPILEAELPVANIYSMHEEADGTLWFTTWSQGLYRIKNDVVKRIRVADGMYDDVAWTILDDGVGNFWFGSNRGIFRVAKRQLDDVAAGRAAKVTYSLFGVPDGMRKRETNTGSPSALRSRDGRLWFATTAGVVSVDPGRIRSNTVPLQVVIERFISDDRIIEDPSPSLRPGSRNVQIHYVAPTLVAPERVQYRYRLEGYDEHWIEAGSRRHAFYTNLDPGSYRFRVIAANENGVWSEQDAAIEFELQPYLYQQRWFLPLTALVLMLLGGVIKLSIDRVRAIRHDVHHDPLTGLANRRLLARGAEKALMRAAARGRSIAILFLDLDGFKAVNDELGHDVGDKVLQVVASRFRLCLGELDMLARIGGDEFAVLIPDLEDETRAANIARRLIDALRDPISIAGQRAEVGVSVGIALHPFDGTEIKGILQAADRAMYRAKLSGGNSYEFNAAEPSEPVRMNTT